SGKPRLVDVAAIDEGKPLQFDTEDDDEKQPADKGRQRVADVGEDRGDLIEDRVLPDGGENADRDGDQQREDEGGTENDQGGRQTLPDEGADIGAGLEGGPPLTGGHALRPLGVLDGEGIGETKLFADVGLDLLG